MSAKYKLVLRKDFSKDAPEGSTKLYAQLVNNGTVGFEELCEAIAEETTPDQCRCQIVSRPLAPPHCPPRKGGSHSASRRVRDFPPGSREQGSSHRKKNSMPPP